MTAGWILVMTFAWVDMPTRQIDNIPSKLECVSMAEEFIEAAGLTKGFNVRYECIEKYLHTRRPRPER
jgi:hypothetical protein